MSELLIGRSSLNVAGLATLVASAPDTDYPASYLVDGQLARPGKLTTTTGDWVWDFGSAQRVDLLSLGPHNLTAGLTGVLFQGNATDVWTAPTLSATVTIPAYHDDGQSVNPWLDLTAASGYSTSGFRYWRLRIGTANAAPVAIGEVALYSQKTTIRNFRVGLSEALRIPAVVHSTTYEVDTTYSLGVARRRMTGDVVLNASEIATVQSWYRAGAGVSDWHTIVIENAVNDARVMRFEGDLSFSRLGGGLYSAQMSFTEVSRGLYL